MSDELTRWALAVPIEARTKQAGRHLQRLVLVALVQHANAHGEAFPGAQTLSEEIAGVDRRSVRAALEQLEGQGLIARCGRAGRAVRYRVPVLSAGMPATSIDDDSAGMPAGHVAGDVAGNSAGTSAGMPATNSTELKESLKADEMKDKPEPTDEALAIFAQSHPGREREALNTALRLFERRHGERCANPARYFGKWTIEQLQAQIRLAGAQVPVCPDCLDGGWIFADPADPSSARKCLHPRRGAAA
jgi:hypothetical protein